MMNSIAPFWDGNETWLVMGGGGLLVAFPLAYSVLLPAFYFPVILMLFGLIMRGVAFEFRFKADTSRRLWDYVFHFGSLGASFAQGMILGAFVKGVETTGRNFSGSPLDWISGFSVMCGIAVVFGYALLGATWLILKTEDETQNWARRVASYVLGFVGIFMTLVSISMPFINSRIADFWFSMPNLYYLAPIPLLTAFLFALTWWDIHHRKTEHRAFFASVGIFVLGYLGLAISIFPWIVPFRFNIWEAAAAPTSLTLVLIGVVPLLPLILGYTTYSYYVFRGKSSHEALY